MILEFQEKKVQKRPTAGKRVKPEKEGGWKYFCLPQVAIDPQSQTGYQMETVMQPTGSKTGNRIPKNGLEKGRSSNEDASVSTQAMNGSRFIDFNIETAAIPRSKTTSEKEVEVNDGKSYGQQGKRAGHGRAVHTRPTKANSEKTKRSKIVIDHVPRKLRKKMGPTPPSGPSYSHFPGRSRS